MPTDTKELPTLIKNARKFKSQIIGQKYTQKMLAADINISQSYVGDIESGRVSPNAYLLGKVAKACGIPFSYFYDFILEPEKRVVARKYSDSGLGKLEETFLYSVEQIIIDYKYGFDMNETIDYEFVRNAIKNYPAFLDLAKSNIEDFSMLIDALRLQDLPETFKEINETVEVNELSPNYFTTHFSHPKDAITFMLKQPLFTSYCNYNLSLLSNNDLIDIADDMLFALQLSIQKIKRNKQDRSASAETISTEIDE